MRRAAVLGAAGYLLLALAISSHTWFGGNLGDRLVGGGGDPLGFVWFLSWLPHALGHGESPLFTTMLMAPNGANLLNSTSIFLPSLLLWPVTAIGGPVVSYDLLVTLGFVLSAYTASIAFLRITPYRASAWIGGAIYGFGGYMTGQAAAHANLLIALFPPLVAMLLDDVRKTEKPARVGALLGLCAAAQVFVNEEILAVTVLMASICLIFLAWFFKPDHALVSRYACALVTATALFAILAGPALVYQFFGPEHVHGVIVSSGRYVNDLAGFFVPNSLNWLSTAGSRHLTDGFSGYDGEFGSYVGVPLIALMAFAGWRLRGRALLPMLVGLCAALLSLGPHLRVLGHDTGLLLPWVIPSHLPLLENVVPSRFNLFVWLAVAALAVLLIDDLRRRPLFGNKALGTVVCVVALIPVLPRLSSSEIVRVPSLAENAAIFRRLAPQAKTVLIVPSANGQQAMYAQAKADFAYRIPDGGVFVPNSDGASYGMRHGPLLYALAALADHASTQAGRTSMDEVCLKQLEIDSTPIGSCRAHYLRAVHALQIGAVLVSELGSPSVSRRYVAFFTAFLGSPEELKGARLFIVGATEGPVIG